jgi:hypothetical protein
MDLTFRIKRWFGKVDEPLPQAAANSLFVYYWDGAAPVPHSVRNVSVEGAEIITAERGYPGTVMNVTLQCGAHTACESSTSCKALSVRSKVVEHSGDGVRVEFLYLNRQERAAARRFLDEIRTRGGR